jgi:FKBP-type peptidyl-prolyl cis-trans isomerase FkpA
MKQTIFTLLLLSTIGFMSCRKNGVQPTLAQYDQTQIQNYIKSNAITGMVKDTVGGDTTGLYYKIINPGTGRALAYTDEISFVFTIKSFDGLYSSTDTISNHFFGYVGHIEGGVLPLGVELAVINDLKHSGGSMRVLIPSELGFGKNGYGSGSINNPGSHIAGNQGLDMYVHVISKEADDVYGTNTLGYQYHYSPALAAYDDSVITHYKQTTGITFMRVPSINIPGVYYYYAIRVPGTGTDSITQNSNITFNYEARELNNTVFQANNAIADTTNSAIPNLVPGVQEALSHAAGNATVSMLLPSALCYGTTTTTGLPINSCLRFEIEVTRVFP